MCQHTIVRHSGGKRQTIDYSRPQSARQIRIIDPSHNSGFNSSRGYEQGDGDITEEGLFMLSNPW